MKILGILLASCLCCTCLAFADSEVSTISTTKKDISFYQANLVCSAAPDIGCGTRAKPVLIDFESHEAVEEAWLNHAGTVIGIVWDVNSGKDKKDILEKTFGKYNLGYSELKGKGYSEQLEDFNKENWYRGKEVDELSKIEAGRIADKVMSALKDKTKIPAEVAPKMRTELEGFFRTELLAIDDANVIYKGSYWERWDEGIAKIGKKHLGERNFPKLSICGDSASASCTNASVSGKTSCCSDESKSSCCSKDKSLK